MERFRNTYVLTNPSGASITVCSVGASWISAFFPDKNGQMADVLAGYASEDGFMSDEHYMGRTVGPFANRVRTEKGIVNHSGLSSFHNQAFYVMSQSANTIRFGLDYEDKQGIYPHLHIEVTYTLSDDNCVTIHHEVQPAASTYLSLTNHAYFNLRGEGTAVAQTFEVEADEYLEMDDEFMPTGRILPIADNSFTLSAPQLVNTCYLLHHRCDYDAKLTDAVSGRCLTIRTTLPAVLFYSGSFLHSTLPSKQQQPLQPCEGVAIETQFCPDTQHNPHFPSCIFTPEHPYSYTTTYQFSVL